MARLLSTSRGTHRGAFTPLDWLLFVAIGAIWGSSFVLIATGLEAFEPGFVTWLRVVSGAAALWLFPSARRPIDIEDRSRVIALSLLWVAIPFTLFPLAQQWVSSAVTGMVNGGVPIVAVAIGSVMLRRLPAPAQVIGLVLGTAGIAMIALPTAGRGSSQALGIVLLLTAVACYGLAFNLAAPIQQRYGALPVMAWMLALASVWTAPYGLIGAAGSSFAWDSLAAVVTLGVVGTGFAFALMGKLIGRVGGSRASFVTYVIPVVALILGVTLRGDVVSAIAVLGVASVIGGALLASRPERR